MVVVLETLKPYKCCRYYAEEKFLRKTLKLARLNTDTQYLRDRICEAFPELSAGDGVDGTFKLWQLRESRTELIPLPVDVNNAHALLSFDQLKRSRVYIKAYASSDLNRYLSFLRINTFQLQTVPDVLVSSVESSRSACFPENALADILAKR